MQANSPQSRPWRMFLPLAIVVVLALAWTAYWFVAIGLAQTEAAAQRIQLAQRGGELQCGAESWGGFPFRFDVTCSDATVRIAGAKLQLATLRAVAQAYNPWHIVILAEGAARATLRDGRSWTSTHERAVASLRFGSAGTPRISVDIAGLHVGELLRSDTLQLHMRTEADQSRAFAVSARGVELTRPHHPPLPIASLEATATLSTGNLLTIQDIALTQDTVTYTGRGAIELDGQNRLSGTLHTETNDLEGLLALIEPQLEIDEEQRLGLRALLGLLGQSAKADIVAKQGELYIGPFKAANLLPLY